MRQEPLRLDQGLEGLGLKGFIKTANFRGLLESSPKNMEDSILGIGAKVALKYLKKK